MYEPVAWIQFLWREGCVSHLLGWQPKPPGSRRPPAFLPMWTFPLKVTNDAFEFCFESVTSAASLRELLKDSGDWISRPQIIFCYLTLHKHGSYSSLTLKGEAIRGPGEGVILGILSTTDTAINCNNPSKHALSTPPHFEGQYCWETFLVFIIMKDLKEAFTNLLMAFKITVPA